MKLLWPSTIVALVGTCLSLPAATKPAQSYSMSVSMTVEAQFPKGQLNEANIQMAAHNILSVQLATEPTDVTTSVAFLDNFINEFHPRRLQAATGSTTLKITYKIKCGGAGTPCSEVGDRLTALQDPAVGLAHAQSIIDAINQLGTQAGFTDSVVISTPELIQSSIVPPTQISITLPPVAPSPAPSPAPAPPSPPFRNSDECNAARDAMDACENHPTAESLCGNADCIAVMQAMMDVGAVEASPSRCADYFLPSQEQLCAVGNAPIPRFSSCDVKPESTIGVSLTGLDANSDWENAGTPGDGDADGDVELVGDVRFPS
jgi:hypothetical protein